MTAIEQTEAARPRGTRLPRRARRNQLLGAAQHCGLGGGLQHVDGGQGGIGKSRIVGFRWSCDKQLRDAVTDFAADSRKANPWAADLYARARARGHDHPHAARILARTWLNIIWHCWQTGEAYDPERHVALQRLLNQDQPEAA